MNFSGQKIVVVGATGVLGSVIAKKLTLGGAEVIGTAGSTESISRIPAEISKRFVVDLADQISIKNFVTALSNDFAKIDGLVIASGVVGFNTTETTSADDFRKITEVNYLGPAQLISELFPLLKNDSELGAFILGISGVVVEQIFPGMGAYSSSKAAFSTYLQTIAKEWRRYKIKVTEARLGHTETGLANRAIFGTAPAMPTGLDPDQVVDLMLTAVLEKKPIINSVDFNN
jgi:cyclic-di-GMP-binding biofilm dispersal mediator protein